MKYESPTTYGSRDIAQVKVLSTDNDDDDDADDAGGMALAFWDYRPGELKRDKSRKKCPNNGRCIN